MSQSIFRRGQSCQSSSTLSMIVVWRIRIKYHSSRLLIAHQLWRKERIWIKKTLLMTRLWSLLATFWRNQCSRKTKNLSLRKWRVGIRQFTSTTWRIRKSFGKFLVLSNTFLLLIALWPLSLIKSGPGLIRKRSSSLKRTKSSQGTETLAATSKGSLMALKQKKTIQSTSKKLPYSLVLQSTE